MRYRFLRFPGGREKAFTMSYDDGCKYDKQLIEIANRHGIKVTLNVNSGLFGKTSEDRKLPARDLKELALSGGHEIAIHGDNHIALGRASLQDGIRDVLVCRECLEKEFNQIIRGMAYADSGIRKLSAGVTVAEIQQYLRSLGIAYARTLGGDNYEFNIPENFYEWMPTVHHGNKKVLEYLEMFLDAEMATWGASRTPFLFYLWGHSYEFHDNNNWDLFEKICEMAGEHEEIWYATNIEICDYVNAYRSLQFRLDNSQVFNPSCLDVWFEMDRKIVCASAGKTTQL